MNPLLGASLIGGAFGLLGSQQDYAHSMEGMQLQHQYEKEMLQLQSEASKNLFQYQFDANNAYNDPSAQYSRLVRAGLNPNLMYQNGSASAGVASGSIPNISAGTSTSLPNFNQGSRAADALRGAYVTYLEGKKVESEVKQNDALTLKTYQEQLTEVERTRQLAIDNLSRKDLNQSQISLNKANIRKYNAEIRELKAKINNLDASSRNLNAQAALAEVNEQLAQIEKQWAPIIHAAQLSSLKASARASDAAAYASSQQGNLFRNQADKVGMENELTRKTWDDQLQRVIDSCKSQGLVNELTAQQVTKTANEALTMWLENKISLATFDAKLTSVMVDLGFHMGASQASDFLKNLGIALAGAGAASGKISSSRTPIGYSK